MENGKLIHCALLLPAMAMRIIFSSFMIDVTESKPEITSVEEEDDML